MKAFSRDRDSVLPLHKQIEHWFREQIESGALSPGEALPARKELSEMLGGVNHLTVRQAIGSLIKDGLLFSVQGRGTFVTETKAKQLRIALVLPNIDDEVTREIARGVHEAFDEFAGPSSSENAQRSFSDVGVVLFDSRHSSEKERQNIAHLQDLPIDGAIIFPVFYGDVVERLVRLKADAFPVVLVDCAVHGIDFDSVEADNYGGSYAATKHLLESGRKRIAWVGNKRGFSSASDRYEGYRDAIADGGLPFDRKLTYDIATASPLTPFEPALMQVINQFVVPMESRPDAIVCNSDIIAVSVLQILAKKGIRVPEDIAIAGFDDTREARECTPPLTTLRQPVVEMGRKAAELIQRRILHKTSEIMNVKMPISLVVRESSFPSAQSAKVLHPVQEQNETINVDSVRSNIIKH